MQRHPALQEFEIRYPFFRTFVTYIGKELRQAPTWGKFFLSLGSSAVSWADIITDLYTIMYYRSADLQSEAGYLLFFVLLSLSLQLAFVGVIHLKDKKMLFVELFATITFVKPAVNKFRVLTNSKRAGHEAMDAVSEMATFKLCETFAESIPVTVIQVRTILKSEELDPVVILALFVSAGFVAETVTYMTYVKDVSEESRRTQEIFYGFIPLNGLRLWVVKASMYVLSLSQLLGKSISIALLFDMGGHTLVLAVQISEMCVFFLYKVLRKDFLYWMPMPSKLQLLISVIVRCIQKIVVDFTGMLHERHPYELGGLCWFAMMFYTQLQIYVVLALSHLGFGDDKEGPSASLSSSNVFIACITLSCTWLVSVIALISCTEKEYRYTFYNSWTSAQFIAARFEKGNDRTKMTIITTVARRMWMPIAPKVKEWLEYSWPSLNNNRPDWFTPQVEKKVPTEYLPNYEGEKN